MAYVYAKVDSLQGTAKVGTKQCVALIQAFTTAGPTGGWTAGLAVVGNLSLAKGTAIATFVDGKYESHRTGNHAAFYISQDRGGIWVMDQWASDVTKPKVAKRYIRPKGQLADGKYLDPSNNANAYSVIE